MVAKEIIRKLPDSPGVYIFKNGAGDILYIGKAKNLKKRVSSYFNKTHKDRRIELLVEKIESIDYYPTSTEFEALLYECHLIKEKKPPFNIDLKDSKTYPYLKLTREKYPRFLIVREKMNDRAVYFGPYTSVNLLRQAVSFIKRAFPLRSCNKLPKKKCLNLDLGQCLGPCVNSGVDISYGDAVKDLKLFLKGRKKNLITNLTERMKKYSENTEFEKALVCRLRLEAISVLLGQSTNNMPLSSELKELKDALDLRTIPARIEAFDISNMHGKDAVGSMVTFFNAVPFKDGYRRFRIRTVNKIDDYLMIKEVVRRRYSRLAAENKTMPDLILIDGGLGHLNSALEELKELELNIPVISIAKQNEIIFAGGKRQPIILPKRSKALQLIQRVRDEAHRFAINYHKLLRKKSFFGENDNG